MISPRPSADEWASIVRSTSDPIYEAAFISMASFELRTFQYRAWVFPLHLDARFRPGDTIQFTITFRNDQSAMLTIHAQDGSDREQLGEILDLGSMIATPQATTQQS